ncbi:MAG: hypothetical protein AAGL69_05525 [Pseudomonadota bacterium]
MKDLETQLRRDAEALRDAHSRVTDGSLRSAIAADERGSRQPSSTRPTWLAWALPIAVAAAAAWFLIATPGSRELPTPANPQLAAITPIAETPLDVRSLQRVSSTAPLEAEWEALLSDLERARNQIEQELPTEF